MEFNCVPHCCSSIEISSVYFESADEVLKRINERIKYERTRWGAKDFGEILFTCRTCSEAMKTRLIEAKFKEIFSYRGVHDETVFLMAKKVKI